MQKYVLVLSICALIVSSGAVIAQNPTENHQPVAGNLHKREVALRNRIKALFKAGRIDDTANANLLRDLDAICTREEELRARDEGFTPKASAEINEQLTSFETRIKTQETAK